MHKDYLEFLSKISVKLEFIYCNTKSNISEKEKEIKKCVQEAVDEHPDFGETTKHDLKKLIEVATSEKSMFDIIATYMASHNCNN